VTDYRSWTEEDAWWRENFSTRPYSTGQEYEEFQPGYRYGYESARHHLGRTWDEAETDLRTGWDKFEGKGPGGAAWEDVKDAVKDAWHRITGQHSVDPDKMAEFEKQRLSGGARRPLFLQNHLGRLKAP
jgi:hypothetical protein